MSRVSLLARVSLSFSPRGRADSTASLQRSEALTSYLVVRKVVHANVCGINAFRAEGRGLHLGVRLGEAKMEAVKIP